MSDQIQINLGSQKILGHGFQDLEQLRGKKFDVEIGLAPLNSSINTGRLMAEKAIISIVQSRLIEQIDILSGLKPVQSVVQKTSDIKTIKCLNHAHPLIRNFVLEHPKTTEEKLAINQNIKSFDSVKMASQDAVKDLDLIFVLKGSLQVTFQPLVITGTHKESQLSRINKSIDNSTSGQPLTPKHAARQHGSVFKSFDSDISQDLPGSSQDQINYQSTGSFSVTINPGQMIDPDKLKLTVPYLSSQEFKSLPFFHQVNSRQSDCLSQSDQTQQLSRRSQQSVCNIPNPVFGHRIISIRSSSANSKVFVIDKKIFKQFLSVKSPFYSLSDKKIREMVDFEYGLTTASPTQKALFFAKFRLKTIPANTLLLQEGQIPSEIISVLSGEILTFKLPTLETHQLPQTSKSLTNVKQKFTSGGFGVSCSTLEGSTQNLITVGLDCPLLQAKSSFTYINKTPLVVLYISLETLLRQYKSVYPQTVTNIQQSLEDKFQKLAEISHSTERVTIEWSEATIEQQKEKSQLKLIQEQVVQNNPHGCRPVQNNLKSVYQRKRDQGLNPGAPNFIHAGKIRGFITQDDMLRLDRTKNKLFFDYDKVDTYLRYMRQKNLGQQSTGAPLVKTLMLSTDGFAKLDDKYQPLSSRSIIDYKEHITVKGDPFLARTLRNKFEKHTRNSYFDQLEAERLKQEARIEETEKERAKQLFQLSCPSIRKSVKYYQGISQVKQESQVGIPNFDSSTNKRFGQTTKSPIDFLKNSVGSVYSNESPRKSLPTSNFKSNRKMLSHINSIMTTQNSTATSFGTQFNSIQIRK